MALATVAAGYPAALLQYIVGRVGRRAALLELTQLREDTLADPDNRVPLTQYLRLFDAGIEFCDDQALALHFGEDVPMREISLMGLVGQFATSAEELCELHNRYGRLTMDDGDGITSERMSIRRDSAGVWLMFTSPLYVRHPVLTEAMVARCVCGIRSMYAATHNGDRWPYPKAIHFAYPRPAHYREYERLFDTPLVFNSDRNAWLMDAAFTAARLPPADTYAAHAFRRHADALLERLSAAYSVRGEVERVVAPMVPQGVSMPRVAHRLGVSRQTLLRRLKTEDTTFAEVVDQLRRRLALRQVADGQLPTKRIAAALGYADAAAFSKAFKRWTGRSPRDYVANDGANQSKAGQE